MTALLWRCVYGALEVRFVVALVRVLVAAMSMVVGQSRTDGFVAALDRRLVRSGWPYHAPGWVNLHLARFLATVQHPRSARRTRSASTRGDGRHSRLRLGVFGAFSGLLGFPKSLFSAFPREHDLVLFDVEYGGAFAAYLASLPATYVRAAVDTAAGIAKTVDVIHRADLDLLIMAMAKRPAYELLDQLDLPCVAHYSNGSEPMYHANVDFHLFPQPQADYFIVDGGLFCTTTRTWFDRQPFFPIDPYYDLRDLDLTPGPGFRHRERLVTFHGSLYKLAQPEFLNVLLGMLAGEPDVQLVFMGKDNGTALDTIRQTAARLGVAGRVHYEGVFSSTRGANGNVDDAGWSRMKSLLSRARLAANPWPLGGGSARIEAYAAGVPCPGIRLSFHERDWNRRQAVVCDVPAIHVPSGSAWSPAEYVDICRRTLHDQRLFEQIVAEQQHAVARLTDAGRWWRTVLDAYFDWQQRSTLSQTAA